MSENGGKWLLLAAFALAYSESKKRARGGVKRRYGGYRRRTEGFVSLAEWRKIPAWKREAVYQAKQRYRARRDG